jgi:hypothetical protein
MINDNSTGSHSSDYEEMYSDPVHQCFGGTYCLSKTSKLRQEVFWFLMVFWLAYSSFLKMEAVCSSETSVNFHWTAWCYVPEDNTVQLYVYFFAVQ